MTTGGPITPWLNRLKQLPGWALLALLAGLMSIGAAGSVWVAGTRPDPVWQGFWAGIATTCVGIFGTVFLVDRLLKRVEARRRSGLALHVRQRVSRIAFYETDKLITLLGGAPEPGPQRHSRRDAADINRLPDGFATLVDSTIAGLKPRLAQLDERQWASLGRSFERAAMEYARLISLFGYEMEAEVLRAMLRAEESAHRLTAVIAERADGHGPDGVALDEATAEARAMHPTLDLIAFHIERIMLVNVTLLRTV